MTASARTTFPALARLHSSARHVRVASVRPPVQIEAFNINILQTKGSLFATRPTLNHYAAKREDLLATANDLFNVVGTGAVKIPTSQQIRAQGCRPAPYEDLEGRKTTGSVDSGSRSRAY